MRNISSVISTLIVTDHTPNLDKLLFTIPNAKIIQLHRDPKTCITSLNSLFYSTHHSVTNDINPQRLGEVNKKMFSYYLKVNVHHHTATEWYRKIMHAEIPGVARTQIDFVDVRDLVDIFVKALTVTDAAGKRFICNGATIPLIEFADILHQKFSNRGYRIPNRILPDFVVRLIALFIPKVKAVAGQLQWKYAFSTEQVRVVFGWQLCPYQQTIIDMAESLIQYSLV